MSDVSKLLGSWVQGFPRERVEARLAEIEEEAAEIRGALALADALGGERARNGSDPAKDADSDRPPSRPAAIRRVLRDRGNEPMAPSAIKEEMSARGWLEAGEVKLFYSAMSTMYKRGHILRLSDGGYILSKTGAEMD
ncbi:MAG TPA: hypothetical protein VGX69_06145 [Solirubrobacteraceae bacterium]|jgi:hypothetical protein|nr:hypothetical protein [Solirubrobacteraceae bacterium]